MPQKTGEGTPLTPTAFYILLALSEQDQHGYGIIKSILEKSNGQLRLGAGVLYSNLKRFIDLDWIEELEERPVSNADDERRRYYRLSKTGHKVAKAEAKRLQEMVRLAAPLLRGAI